MSTTSDPKFAKTHEWIRLESEDIAVVGISEHAQESLGDITFVELPQVGTVFNKGDTFGVVESVKAASDLYAPVGGEVVEVNEALDDAPEQVNQSPQADGWIIKLKISDPSELDGLLSQEEYENSI